MDLLLQILGYVIAAVFIGHVLYFAGAFLVMAAFVIAAPFAWAWQALRAKQIR